jgi:hypothetical protein
LALENRVRAITMLLSYNKAELASIGRQV